MMRFPMFGLFVVTLLAGVGCSSAPEDASAGESSDAIRESKGRRTTELFRPDESTLTGSVASTYAGIERWDVYESEKGVTVRGVSATKKIKVVYVVPIEMRDGKASVSGAGYLRASDFELPADDKEALRVLTEAIRADVAPQQASGIETQGFADTACSIGHGILFQVVTSGVAAWSAYAVGSTVCITTLGAGCVAAAVVAMVATPVALYTPWMCAENAQK